MTDAILTLNAGSSSIKFAAYSVEAAALTSIATGLIEGFGGQARFKARTASGEATDFALQGRGGPVGHEAALRAAVDWLEKEEADCRIVAVGHRIVHGGPDFAEPIRIDAALLETLRRFIPLAPLHQPHNLEGVEAAMQEFPHAVQVACFDTAFHRAHPFVADTFALPQRFYQQGVRRYGFHGLSYEFVSRRLRVVAPHVANGRVVIAHLGNGASACGLRRGRSVASTMGFTALDGLPMGTRCGQLDPGVVLYLMAEKGMSPAEISDLLYKESGLLGLSGVSNDMRALEASDAPAARQAIDYFVERVKREIGGLAAAIGGLDAIVFAGGIGEHAASVRAQILEDMAWLGVKLDSRANARNAECVTTPDSPTPAYVVATDEERMIAEHTAQCAGLARSGAEAAAV
jgi:acetate kinase